jgi:hypothetical protein
VEEVGMGDSVERFRKVKYGNVYLLFLVEGGQEVMGCGEELGFTRETRSEAVV